MLHDPSGNRNLKEFVLIFKGSMPLKIKKNTAYLHIQCLISFGIMITIRSLSDDKIK